MDICCWEVFDGHAVEYDYLMLLCFVWADTGVVWQSDWGAMASALTGQWLCLAFCLAVSIFASVLTREPIAAGLLGALLLLPFWMVDSLSQTIDTLWVRQLCQDLSLMHHLDTAQ